MTKNFLLTLSVFLGCLCWTVPVASGEKNSDSKLKVVVTGLPEARFKELEQTVLGVEFVAASGKDLLEKVAQADAVIGSCSPEMVRTAKRLRWIQIMSVGVEKRLFPELVESDITLTNMKIVNGPDIADHAMALLLSLTRNLTVAISTEGWSSRGRYRPIVLDGKTALIIGLGGIGTQVAERAAAFGMTILAIDPRDVPLTHAVEQVRKPHRLRDFLPLADVVFVCAPHTPKTEGLLGPSEFALMKKGSYLINVSRGKVVQTDALVQALEAGRLAGAGLDVVNPEPLPNDHPLWKFDNVVITPHIAYRSDRADQRKFELLKENLILFSKGQPLHNVVDKHEGY